MMHDASPKCIKMWRNAGISTLNFQNVSGSSNSLDPILCRDNSTSPETIPRPPPHSETTGFITSAFRQFFSSDLNDYGPTICLKISNDGSGPAVSHLDHSLGSTLLLDLGYVLRLID